MASALMPKPKKPDTSKQEALLAQQEQRISQQETETKRRETASMNARQRRARSSLIKGAETGVLRENLG